MIPELRNTFNEKFSSSKYELLIQQLEDYCKVSVPFRIAETPVFIPQEFMKMMLDSGDAIIDFIQRKDFKALTEAAIPSGKKVPGDEGHADFLAFDFAVSANEEGNPVPALIELQGFPSLFFYQHLLAEKYQTIFKLPERLTHLFDSSPKIYLDRLRDIILNGHDPEAVIMLDIEPEKQHTFIDFYATAEITGVKVICISKLFREGSKLFYREGDQKIRVRRIYNRVIFDELEQRKDLLLNIQLTDEADVEWAGHPNWFYRISKYTMPLLPGSFIPETRYLNSYQNMPDKPGDYVLKPLFSFSGKGVELSPDREMLEQIPDPENWILQRKVVYAPIIRTPDDPAKAEIRMMYIRDMNTNSYKPVITLVRISKGKMTGVRYNRDKSWVGSSVGFWWKDTFC